MLNCLQSSCRSVLFDHTKVKFNFETGDMIYFWLYIFNVRLFKSLNRLSRVNTMNFVLRVCVTQKRYSDCEVSQKLYSLYIECLSIFIISISQKVFV